MSNTANLVLPYLAVGQAQKHVTVNESLRRLDAIIQLSVASATTTAQPTTPTDGAVYILPSGKTGTHWAAFASGSLGYYRDGAWVEIVPREGWLAFVRDTDQLLCYTGPAWSLFPAAKILTLSATDKLLGRASPGAGAAEEIACTAFSRSMMDDADAASARTTLGLGTMATQAASSYAALSGAYFSGPSVPLFVNSTNNAFPVAISVASVVGGLIGTNGGGGLRLADASGAVDIIVTSSGVTVAGASLATRKTAPSADNTYTCGDASFRWSEVYAAAGSINTSDAREKAPLRAFSRAETRAIRRVFASAGVFQWLDALALKGEAARLHAGVTAQAVAEAFEAEGLDPSRYGLFCADALEEEIETEETVRVKRPVAGPERELIEIVGGKPVLKRVREPLRRIEAVVDENGEAIVRGGKALTHEVGVTEEVEVTRPARIRRPKFDESGEPVTRLGVRYDQLFTMALAALMAPGD